MKLPPVKRRPPSITPAEPEGAAVDDDIAVSGPDIHDVKEMAREHGAAAIARLVHWMQSNDARMSIAACNALLDRGFGKISSTGDGNGQLGIRHEDALALLD